MLTLFKKLAADESGVTAIEYGLIAALVAVALITALQALEGSLAAAFTTISGDVTAAVAGG